MTQFDAFADFRMNNHHVIITGGAQNIGAGIAKTLASAGANVMIADLQGDKAKETAANIEGETSSHCRGMACDVTNSEDINAVVAATVEAFGGISTLINNVGWGARHDDPTAISDQAFIDSYKLNTISAYRTYLRRRIPVLPILGHFHQPCLLMISWLMAHLRQP